MLLSKQNHLTLEEAKNIQRIYIDEYGYPIKDKYPSIDTYRTQLEDLNLVNRIDNRLISHILPFESGFNNLHEMVNILNLTANHYLDKSPNNILDFASKISHLDNITQECLYDNIDVVMRIMHYTTFINSNSCYMDRVLNRLYTADVYFKHCGYRSIKINDIPLSNRKVRRLVKSLLVRNDRFLGVAR